MSPAIRTVRTFLAGGLGALAMLAGGVEAAELKVLSAGAMKTIVTDLARTGTPGGVGSRRNPPVWMAKGDEVEVDISGVGVLRNPIVEE